MQQNTCPKCQTPFNMGNQYCGNCGNMLPKPTLNLASWATTVFDTVVNPTKPTHMARRSYRKITTIVIVVLLGTLFGVLILGINIGRLVTITGKSQPNSGISPVGKVFTPTSIIPRATLTLVPTQSPTLTPSPTPTMEPTPTSTPGIKPGDVLYTADFNNKASDWSFDNNWFISNGKLIGKPENSQALLNVPIPTTDYTVKASIIITQVGTFGVVARYQSPTQGDTVALAWVTNTYIALSTCASDDCAGPTSDRIPFLQTNHVYNLMITCKGVHITVTGEGHIISTDDTSNAPAAGNVALFNQGMGVEVLSLQIIAA